MTRRLRETPPAEQIENELRWRARWSGMSSKGVEERAKQLAARDPEPEPFTPMPDRDPPVGKRAASGKRK